MNSIVRGSRGIVVRGSRGSVVWGSRGRFVRAYGQCCQGINEQFCQGIEEKCCQGVKEQCCQRIEEEYTVRKGSQSFPSPAGMSLTKLPLGRNNSIMTSLFPPTESLEVTSRLGTGNSRSFFYGVLSWVDESVIAKQNTKLETSTCKTLCWHS
jgi:hypothetical protein